MCVNERSGVCVCVCGSDCVQTKSNFMFPQKPPCCEQPLSPQVSQRHSGKSGNVCAKENTSKMSMKGYQMIFRACCDFVSGLNEAGSWRIKGTTPVLKTTHETCVLPAASRGSAPHPAGCFWLLLVEKHVVGAKAS